MMNDLFVVKSLIVSVGKIERIRLVLLIIRGNRAIVNSLNCNDTSHS